MVYRMIFNQAAYFGRGAIKEIPGVAKSHGFTKAFIVTEPVLLETGTVKKVIDVLDEDPAEGGFYDQVGALQERAAGLGDEETVAECQQWLDKADEKTKQAVRDVRAPQYEEEWG